MKQATRGYVPPLNEEERILQRKVADAVKTVCHTGMSKYTAFMNDREKELAVAELNRLQWQSFLFDGGHDEAEREILAVYLDVLPVFPIQAVSVQISAKAVTNLNHRDFLGSFLGTGIKRECIGDILVYENGAVAYVQENIVPFLQQEIGKIGRYSAKLEIANKNQPVQILDEPEKRTASIASLRLDCVISAMLHTSRNEITQLIKKDLIQVNHLSISSPHYQVCEGDIFSVRGIGKFKLCGIGGYSRKNRIFIEYIKY